MCAGFPCQPFSVSGKQNGFNDTRGTLFFEIKRIVAYHKPKTLLLENVKNLKSHNNGETFKVIKQVLNNLKSHNNGETFKVIKQVLNNLGYNIYYKILNAKNYGLPQNRERIVIIGFRKDIDNNTFEFPNTYTNFLTIYDIKEKDIKTKKYIINRKDI